MLISINDKSTYPITKREYTDEGFLRVPGYVAKTGIQEYTASELSLDGDPNRIVRVMRPADEVFNSDSLDSYMSVDVTLGHPIELVSSETYKKDTVGTVTGSATKDGDFVVADLIIKDQDAIKQVQAGTVQLSAGYTTNYDDAVPEGADYEFIQRDIKINHVALVSRARAGAQARIFDNQKKDRPMGIKVNLDSGRSVEVEDQATATLIGVTIDGLKQQAKDATEEKEKIEAEKDKVEAEKDALEEEAKKAKAASSDEAITKRVAEISKTLDSAKKVAGKEFTSDSVNVIAIKRESLAVAKPTRDWADKSDVYIAAAFDMEEEKTEEDDDEENESHKKLASDAAKHVVDSKKLSARDESIKASENAWKGEK